MASGVTNRGKIRLLEMALRDTQDSAASDTAPMYLALMRDTATSLSATTIVFDTGAEIATGNGYTAGGDVVTRDGSDLTVWDVLSDTASGSGKIQLKDICISSFIIFRFILYCVFSQRS